MTVLVMGVSGSGKSTLAAALAASLDWTLLEADEFHSTANKTKMASGHALTDEDRWPWLDELASALRDHATRGEPAVLACSALKEAYRKRLRTGDPDLLVVWLHGPREVLSTRMQMRRDHFMPATLLDAQFATLEEPQDAVKLDATQPTAAQLAAPWTSSRFTDLTTQ